LLLQEVLTTALLLLLSNFHLPAMWSIKINATSAGRWVMEDLGGKTCPHFQNQRSK
jgi:hypothetical protein